MSSALEEAIAHHRAGRLEAAERLYEDVLRADSNAADAWQFLGLIALSRGDAAGAVARIERAIALKPETAVYHFNLGLAWHQQGEVSRAIASYRQAIKFSPGLAEAHTNLGNCLLETGNAEGAALAFRRAAALQPTSSEVHVNLSKALLALKRPEAAENTIRRALSLEGDRPLAEFQLGNILQVQGRYAEAAEAYRSVLRSRQTIDGVRVNFGNALVALGDYEAAGQMYREALSLNPNDLQAHFGFIRTRLHLTRYDEVLAAVAAAPEGGPSEARDFAEIFTSIGLERARQGDARDACTWFAKAAARDPSFVPAQFNLGLAYQNEGRLNDAIDRYTAAIELEPGAVEARKNLALLRLMLGQPGGAIAVYREGAAIRPDVSDFQRLLVAATFYDPAWSNEDRYIEARRFAERYGPDERPPARRVSVDQGKAVTRRLRIGYFSSDFRDHPISRNIEPLLAHRDRARFDAFLYAELRRPDEMTARLEALADGWRVTTGRSDEEVAGQMRSDGLDILVLLAGHLDENRPLICTRRPASVQIAFHDVTTSGLDDVDYFLADRVVCPRSSTERFTERVIRLPSIYAHEPIADAPPVDALPCRSTGVTTFGSFNNPAKLNGATLGLWGRILQAVPSSRLLLKFRRWFESPDLQARVIAALAPFGIEAARIEFTGADDRRAVHLGLYNRVDIALDTFPFAGSTTTFEALWMGVPVVTLMGGTMMSRWSGSMMKALRLDGLAADTPDAYVGLATALAADRDRLAELRAGLRDRIMHSPIVNGPLRARQIERIYQAVWARWYANTPAAGKLLG
ncbi:MAG TPA: tetratricopeptide repeat protein [Alphaproteobacteria bacterium]|nr:tetratricopeptide repeat protein [Alphaproteobacteria bacterium]